MTRIITLGEIMLRLSTSSGVRLEQSGRFAAHYGGGEANVAISLANYGHDVSLQVKSRQMISEKLLPIIYAITEWIAVCF